MLFERYLQERRLAYLREPQSPGKRKRPDFQLIAKGRSFRFEVEEFAATHEKISGSYDPLPSIREKIEDARKQFKEYRDDCCAVVLHSCQSAVRTFHSHD